MQPDISHYQDLVVNAAVIGFLIIAGVILLVILILGILNFARDRARRATLVLQALGAVIIWIVLTFVIFFVDLGYLVMFEFAAMHDGKKYESPARTALLIGLSFLIYILAGGALIYWTKRQTRRSMGSA